MYGCGERGHEGERSGGGEHREQGGVEDKDALWRPRIGKSRKKKKKKKQHLVHQTASLSKNSAAKDLVCLSHKSIFAGLKVLKLTYRRVTPLEKP